MGLTPGARLGPYEIVSRLGAGGMGEVYRARDHRLHRDVAIKIIREDLVDPAHVARFTREARAAATLSHANVVAVYDVGEYDGSPYIVSELIEGETLRERLSRGALSLPKAIDYAHQIARGLAAAHQHGITHRDLKPENIGITRDGRVKILDFGLAKLIEPDRAGAGDDTVSMHQTATGAVVGTVGYMSPEQVLGAPVDRRTDIFAFGAVVFEMLTGRRAFHCATPGATMAAILADTPRDWDADSRVPVTLQRIIERCLDLDPSGRFQSADDLAFALEALSPVPVARPGTRRMSWHVGGAILSGFVLCAAVATVVVVILRRPPRSDTVRFTITPTPDMAFINGGAPAVSPNGQWVVFPAIGTDRVTRMWLRPLNAVDAHPLVGTESPNSLPPPVFWSADSRSIAFSWTASATGPGQLKTLPITGGPVQTLCDIGTPAVGGAWNRDGVIIFGSNSGPLRKTSAAGAPAVAVTALSASRHETAHRAPQFLPDGRRFLYHRRSMDPAYTGVYVGSLDVPPDRQDLHPLLISDRQAVYVPGSDRGSGHLLFMRDTAIYAQAFDTRTLMLSGEARPVADFVGSFAPANYGLFSTADTDVLAYRAAGGGGARFTLRWFDRDGHPGDILGRGGYNNPTVSLDGSHVAVRVFSESEGTANIWIIDTQRRSSTRLTFDTGTDDLPVWLPDGKNVVFRSNRSGHFDLYQKSIDGSGGDRLVVSSQEDKIPDSVSADGRFLLYTATNLSSHEDLWIAPIDGSAPARVLLQTEFRERNARISPDARWFAYTSDESGADEIYVRPVIAPANVPLPQRPKWMISRGGGVEPRWSHDGRELFYSHNFDQMAVPVTTGETFTAGEPQRLFTGPARTRAVDVSANGRQFLFVVIETSTTQPPFVIVLNWRAGLRLDS